MKLKLTQTEKFLKRFQPEVKVVFLIIILVLSLKIGKVFNPQDIYAQIDPKAKEVIDRIDGIIVQEINNRGGDNFYIQGIRAWYNFVGKLWDTSYTSGVLLETQALNARGYRFAILARLEVLGRTYEAQGFGANNRYNFYNIIQNDFYPAETGYITDLARVETINLNLRALVNTLNRIKGETRRFDLSAFPGLKEAEDAVLAKISSSSATPIGDFQNKINQSAQKDRINSCLTRLRDELVNKYRTGTENIIGQVTQKILDFYKDKINGFEDAKNINNWDQYFPDGLENVGAQLKKVATTYKNNKEKLKASMGDIYQAQSKSEQALKSVWTGDTDNFSRLCYEAINYAGKLNDNLQKFSDTIGSIIFTITPGIIDLELSTQKIAVFPPGIFGKPATPQGYRQIDPQTFIDIIVGTPQRPGFLLRLSEELFILLVVIGGILYILGPFKPDNINKAKDWIKYAVIGYFIILVALAAISLVKGLFG